MLGHGNVVRAPKVHSSKRIEQKHNENQRASDNYFHKIFRLCCKSCNLVILSSKFDKITGFSGLAESRPAMSDEKHLERYPDLTELYRRKEANRKSEAKRPISEKMETVARLRDFERSMENIRKANRAKRAAKEIKIQIKTR